MSNANVLGPSAGFWRRLLAIIVDCLFVLLPFMILASILFPLTDGAVQMPSGIYRECRNVEISNQLANLAPAPPEQSNFAVECQSIFLGFQTARILVVGRTTRDGATTKSISQSYMLNSKGKLVNGFSMDGLFFPSFFVYLVLMVGCGTDR